MEGENAHTFGFAGYVPSGFGEAIDRGLRRWAMKMGSCVIVCRLSENDLLGGEM